MTLTRLAVLAALAIVSLHYERALAEEPIYTKTSSLPPLRVTYEQLESVLNKTATLMSTANGPSPEGRFSESVQLKYGDSEITISGHQLPRSGAKLPRLVTEFRYTASENRREAALVATISMIFGDDDRRITVEGRSPEQVDAVFASLRSDFSVMSSPIGGFTFRYFSGFLLLMACGLVAAIGVLNWFATRDRGLILPVLLACLGIGLLVTLPFAEFLAGFSVSDFDPTFSSRYASEISVVGLVLAIVGIPLSYLLPKWFATPAETNGSPAIETPNPSLKGARRKRRAP